jgi:hypothetical protein
VARVTRDVGEPGALPIDRARGGLGAEAREERATDALPAPGGLDHEVLGPAAVKPLAAHGDRRRRGAEGPDHALLVAHHPDRGLVASLARILEVLPSPVTLALMDGRKGRHHLEQSLHGSVVVGAESLDAPDPG